MANRTALFNRVQPGGVYTIDDFQEHPGDIYFVDSGQTSTGADSSGYGRNPDAPFLTIDYAVSQCTASQGDVIYVLPGHAETVASATACVLDIAGVSVIGLGRGSLMPKLTLSTDAGATLSVTAADCMVKNIWLYCDYTGGVTAGVTAAATADGLVLDGLLFTEAANTKEFLIGISLAAGCNDVVIQNCRYCGTAGGTTSSIIAAAGAANNLIIANNYLHGDCSAAAVKLDAAASTDIQVIGNRVINIDTAAGLGIDAHDTTTGMMVQNFVTNLKDTVEGCTGDGMAYHECYGSNALNVQGILKPVADS